MAKSESKSDQRLRREDASKRAEVIGKIVAAGRAAGHPMTFAERVANSYADVAKGGAR